MAPIRSMSVVHLWGWKYFKLEALKWSQLKSEALKNRLAFVCDLMSPHCEVREIRSSQWKLNESQLNQTFGTIRLLSHTAQDTPVPADAMTAQLMKVGAECRMSLSSVSSVAPFLMVHFILQGWECSHSMPFPSLVWKLRSGKFSFSDWTGLDSDASCRLISLYPEDHWNKNSVIRELIGPWLSKTANHAFGFLLYKCPI